MTVIVESRRGRRLKRQHRSSLEIEVAKPGGLRREEAIAEADRRVEAMRDTSMKAIQSLLLTLNEAAIAAADDQAWTVVRKRAVQIITLSQTYGLTFLAEAAMRLCDFICASQARAALDSKILMVYVNAVCLCGQGALSASSAEAVLGELDSLSSHLNVAKSE